jgi:cob(I)alamin adenosyltransferase
MVYLSRIYTKTGDSGHTSLGDGSRVPKTDRRIAAYGGVDELNSVIGLGIAAGMPEELAAPLRRIQNDLFDLGADLCVPLSDTPPEYPELRVTEAQVTRLEQLIDGFTDRLKPLDSFILPGGSLAAGHLHQARVVCRRVEIGVIEFTQTVEGAHAQCVIYLNRLSDLLFVMARIANDEGRADVKWVPGANREG